MARNVKQTGPVDRVGYVNDTGSAVSSGDLVVRESGTTGCVGLALVDIATAGSGQVLTKGIVRDVTAETGVAWSEGDKLYLTAGGQLTKTAGSNTYAGRAAAAKASAAAVGELNLNE